MTRDKTLKTTRIWQGTIRKLGLLSGMTGKSQTALIDELVTERLDAVYPEWKEIVSRQDQTDPQ